MTVLSQHLALDAPAERALSSGETQAYGLKLSSGQFVRLVADQRGIDVTLRLSSPDGKQIWEINNSWSEIGPENASYIAEATGTYRLEVYPSNRSVPSGRYELKIEALRPSTEQDRILVSAEQTFTDANRLLNQRTREAAIQAIAKYESILTVFEAASDLRTKAVILNNLGKAFYVTADYQKAVEYHNRSLPVARSVSDRHEEAGALTSLGQSYRAMAQNHNALEVLGQALRLWQLLGNKRNELEVLINIGSLHYLVGHTYEALLYYDRGLELARAIPDRNREVRLLSAIGLAHYALGDYQQALDVWSKGLELSRQVKYRSMEAVILGHLGSVYDALGEHEKALATLNQTLQMVRAGDERIREATTLQSIGRVYYKLGQPRKSIEFLDQSLVVLKDARSLSAEARAYYNLGKAYTDLAEYQKALGHLNQAVSLYSAIGNSVNAAAAIHELARVERGLGDLAKALAHSETALNILELLRAGAGREELRESLFATTQKYFEQKIDLLMSLDKSNRSGNYAALALETSERARARTMLDSIAEAGVNIREGMPADLIKREQAIQNELSAKAIEQVRLTNARAAAAQIEQNSRRLQELSNQYGRVQAEIRAQSRRLAAMTLPGPLSVKEIQRSIVDDGSVLLEYYLGEQRSYLWVVTPNSIHGYELPKRETVEGLARQVYESLSARNRTINFETPDERRRRLEKADSDYSQHAVALSRMVIGPAAIHFRDTKLLIVSDGALQYIPFAALPAPAEARNSNQPLGLKHEIVNLPSASALAVLRREITGRAPAPKTLAVLADPVFDVKDERVRSSLSRGKPATEMAKARSTASLELDRSARESGWDTQVNTIARLPFTRQEANAISSLVPASQRKEVLDFAASLPNAKSSDLSSYRIVHFATHGFLNSRHPELSGLVLSLVDETGAERDGFLRAHDIYNLHWPADMVVLSGCRTGLGKEVKGEGLVGLTRAFMHAGAARVMVSLWDVNDEATAELMKRFYGSMLGPARLTPAAALRAAQISLSQEKRWAAPYYWAAFTLQGEPH